MAQTKAHTGWVTRVHTKTVVFDVDGCLLNFFDPYVAFIHRLGFTHVKPEQVKSYLFLSDFGFTPEESLAIFKQFTKEGGFRNLEPYPGAKELLVRLRAHNHKVVLATAAPSRARDDRLENLADLHLPFDHIEFTHDKHEVVKKHDAVLVLDDHPNTLSTCLEQTRAIVARPLWSYNEHIEHPGILCLGPHPGALMRLADYLVDSSVGDHSGLRGASQTS
jgi:phosphoglycolate phosphatase-like HAD superfamily hydrolase